MKQFVPSDVCLSCDGCCRFKEKESEWRPKVACEEMPSVPARGLADVILREDKIDSSGRIKTVPCDGFHICSFFNPDDHACRIHNNKPFECQLYPFILLNTGEKIALSVHLNCPYIQETRNTGAFDSYVEYLKRFFKRDDVLLLVRENPQLAGDYEEYRSELEVLFPLEI